MKMEEIIMNASVNDDTNTIINLHGSGVDVNNILPIAAKYGNVNIIKYLCEHGANINMINGYYNDSVVQAVKNGHLDIVEYFFNNCYNGNCDYVLQFAAEEGQVEIFKHMCNNYDIEITRDEIYSAVIGRNLEIIEYMCENCLYNEDIKIIKYILEISSCNGYDEIISYLHNNYNYKKYTKSAINNIVRNNKLQTLIHLLNLNNNEQMLINLSISYSIAYNNLDILVYLLPLSTINFDEINISKYSDRIKEEIYNYNNRIKKIKNAKK